MIVSFCNNYSFIHVIGLFGYRIAHSHTQMYVYVHTYIDCDLAAVDVE